MTRPRRCEQCGATLVAISFTVRGRERTMESCSACGRRVWLSDGYPTELRDVIEDLSATHQRSR